MKKVLLLLADGFEEVEALTPHDMLTRTGLAHVDLVSIMGRVQVATSLGNRILADKLLENIDPEEYDAIVLPGGKVGTDNLSKDLRVRSLIVKYLVENKWVCAICAAPSILGSIGALDGKNFTCFPGFEVGKGNYIDTGSVVDGNIITGHSMHYSAEFAENIIRCLLGQEGLDRIARGTKGLR